MRPFEYSDLLHLIGKLPAASAEPPRDTPRQVQGFSSLHPIMRMRQWADRRLKWRQASRIPVTVHTATRSQSAYITNISEGGVGLSGAEGVAVGDHITLAVGPFISLRGEVKWCREDNCGVQLMAMH